MKKKIDVESFSKEAWESVKPLKLFFSIVLSPVSFCLAVCMGLGVFATIAWEFTNSLLNKASCYVMLFLQLDTKNYHYIIPELKETEKEGENINGERVAKG